VGALIIGLSAGVICYFATQFIKRSLQIDDSLDVFPVHGVGGIVGTILAGVLASDKFGGVGYADGVTMGQQVGIQLIGVAATVAWCAVLTYVILKVLSLFVELRVSKEAETQGLDLSEHDERGYQL
jgi:Amt family ammonium transporter